MAGGVQLDVGKRIVRTRAWGELTDEDLFRHLLLMRRLFAAGVLTADWTHFADLSDVTGIGVTTRGIVAMARDNPWPAQARRIFVVGSNLGYGLMRMYETLAGSGNIRICRSTSEAHARIDPLVHGKPPRSPGRRLL